MSKFGMIAYGGLAVYLVILPALFMWRFSKKSHIIYETGIGKDAQDVTNHTQYRLEAATKCKYGFLYSGLTIAR